MCDYHLRSSCISVAMDPSPAERTSPTVFGDDFDDAAFTHALVGAWVQLYKNLILSANNALLQLSVSSCLIVTSRGSASQLSPFR